MGGDPPPHLLDEKEAKGGGRGDQLLKGQLTRQRGWYAEHWRYLLHQRILPEYRGRRPTALDVGCGPGLVMESFSDLLDVHGLDIDPGMVNACRARGFQATLGDARRLPFRDGSFDIAYCSFLLVWVEGREKVIEEMLRVSRDWVVCLAEPDYAARVDHPYEMEKLTSLIVEGATRQGGDPRLGRKLRSFFSGLGIEAEVGVHPGIWSLERLREESGAEWEWVRGMVGNTAEEDDLVELRAAWDRALQDGSLVQCNPTFYALARKPRPAQIEDLASRQR